MTLRITVDTLSPVPPFEQVRAQLAELIGHGGLAPGDRLPPVRQLASDLGLAVGTVARAYRELERAGQVRSRRGAGTRVSTAAPRPSPEARAQALAAAAIGYVAAARRLGAGDEDILGAVDQALAESAGTVAPAGEVPVRDGAGRPAPGRPATLAW